MNMLDVHDAVKAYLDDCLLNGKEIHVKDKFSATALLIDIEKFVNERY